MALDVPTRTDRSLAIAVGMIILVTLAGLALLWPPSVARDESTAPVLVDATVTAVEVLEEQAASPTGEGATRYRVSMELHDGDQAGQTVTNELLLEGLPPLEVGRNVRAIGSDADGWFIADFDRGPGLWVLAGLFVAAVVAMGGWQGVRSLLGLGISLVLVVRFIVPGIIAGLQPALVALVGAVAVMLVTLYLSHGWTTRSSIAVVGTTIALLLTVGLGLVFLDAAVITGFASEDAVMARFQVGTLDIAGLVLAGLIVAALGVLDDVTVAQAATVWALHDTDETLSRRALFARAMSVGRDHVASTVNTLFLAYAGASLALLVLFTTSGQALGDILTSEVVATELVKTLVGSLGLVTAVPVTTWLAAVFAVRRSPTEIRWSRERGESHAH